MDGFNKRFTSSTSIKPNDPSQGNDENELIEAMAYKLRIDDKKRLMSTTVSAASKDVIPKRNVSAGRNETLDGEEQHFLSRSLSFDSKYSRFSVVDGHGDFKNSLFVESSLQPYDPVKNYLSPRPRYLRYDPDRHHEIVSRQARVNRVRRCASFDSRMPFTEEELESNGDCSLGASSSQEEFVDEKEEIIENSVGKSEDEHEEEMEEEYDDYEEDKGCISNVFLHYFIVTIVLILATLFIASMNSPTLSPAREAIWGFMDLYSKTHNSIYRTVGLIFSEVGYEAFAPMMLMVGKFRDIGYGYEEWDKQGLVVNGELVEGLGIAETKELENNEIDVDQDEEGSDQLEVLETTETKELENIEIDVDQDEEEFDQLEGFKTTETKELENIEIDVDQDEEESDQLEGLETTETKELENIEIDVDQDEEESYQLEELEINENEKIEFKETHNQLQEPEIGKPYEIEAKKDSFRQFLGDDSNLTDVDEEIETEKMVVEEDVIGKEDSNNNELYENDVDEIETTHFLIKLASFDPISTAFIGVSVFILASLSVQYYSKKTKVSSPLETAIAHKNSTNRKNLEPFINPSHSAYKMHSASLMLNRMENEVSKSEDIDFSLSFIHSDAYSASNRKSSHLELSTGESLSRGSFIVEKKIVKKQKSKTPEVMISTVRRSSRIHNQSMMSP